MKRKEKFLYILSGSVLTEYKHLWFVSSRLGKINRCFKIQQTDEIIAFLLCYMSTAQLYIGQTHP